MTMSVTENQLFFATNNDFLANALQLEWTNHILLEDPIGSMLSAKVLSSQIQISAHVLLRWIQPMLLHFEKRRNSMS